MRNNRRKLNYSVMENLKIDFWLFSALLLTIVSGMFVLYSASNQNTAVILNQTYKVLFGFFIMTVVAQIPPQLLKVWTPRIFLVSIILLCLVPIIGEKSLGARRWLDFGIRFQPSELVKFTLPMMLAWFVSTIGAPDNWKRIGACFGLLLFPFGLIVIQPDLGTAILVGAAGFFVIFLAGLSYSFLLKMIVAVAVLIPFAFNYLLKPYQRVRIETMFDPSKDPSGSGYHVTQSKIAIGSGGFSGDGWLQGTQSHLNFIPEQRTDFIFSVLSEEFGMLGFFALSFFYLLVISRCFYMFFKLKESYDRLVTGALIMIFVSYIFVNIGMVTGILPVVGVPLPLISFGGTSMVTLLSGFGLISGFYHQEKLKSFRR